MSAGTIKRWKEIQEKQAERDRPSTFLGCHCGKCHATWLVCEMPQPMKYHIALTSKHKYCPNCKEPDILLATVEQIRPLLVTRE